MNGSDYKRYIIEMVNHIHNIKILKAIYAYVFKKYTNK